MRNWIKNKMLLNVMKKQLFLKIKKELHFIEWLNYMKRWEKEIKLRYVLNKI